MMDRTLQMHLYFGGMIIAYSVVIYHVYHYYDKNNCISNIICNTQLRYDILLGMLLMGIFVILYEQKRNCKWSQVFIYILLLCLYLLLFLDEKSILHIVLSYIIFLCILSFLYIHKHKATFLTILFYIYVGFTLGVPFFQYTPLFFHIELILLLCFAIYYIYLHFIDSCPS